MGTMLYSKGVFINSCFDELNLSAPDLVKEVHLEYMRSGAEILETNTFGANRYKLKKYGLEEQVSDINRAGARIAREAGEGGVYIAGSIGPLGIKIEPWGPTSIEEAEAAFREQASGLLEGGIDLFILETFSDLNEIHQAIKAIQKLENEAVIVAQMTIEEDGNSLYGTSPEVFVKRLDQWGVHVLGVNCSVGPSHMLQCIEKMTPFTDRPLSAMPNAGIPRAVEGRNIYLCSPEYLAEYTKRFILNGVKIVGGCCGTTPAHIKAMQAAIRALQPPTRKSFQVKPVSEGIEQKEVIPIEERSDMARRLSQGEFVVSVEVVPPRGHDPARATSVASRLKTEGIDFVNIPDGPRASARMSPMALAFILRAQTEIEPVLHYACRDRNLLGMQSDLLGIYAQGIRNILIITGDPPKLGDYPDATAVFDVDSIGLTNVVNYLNHGVDIGAKRLAKPTGFHIGVGANPGAINLEHEISRFAWKVEAGAEFAITQPVFDVEMLKEFLKRIANVRIPVLAGIWPLLSLRNAEFLHNEVPGGHIPSSIMQRMQAAQEKGSDAARNEGVAIAQEIVREIKGLVDGIQISPPLGKYEMVFEVLKAL